MHYQQGGEKYPFHSEGGVLHQVGEKWEKCICLGGLAFMQGELIVSPEFDLRSFADGVEPFCLTSRSRQFWSILSRLC
jgi:hypothetical protein